VDEAAFEALVRPHRAALEAHCYRMLGSVHDAEDVAQESLLRAWKAADRFDPARPVRPWLVAIATNRCLTLLAGRARREFPEPYPDARLEASAEDSALARESVELAFVTALQELPPRQRAALLLCEVLAFPAAEAAAALGTTTASVTSALQRARVTMREHLAHRRLDWRSPAARELSDDERDVLRAYIEAHERNDLAGLTALLRDDLRFTMLPGSGTTTVGARDAVEGWVAGGLFGPGYDDWRGLATTVNRMPAAALYVRTAGDTDHRLLNIAVLGIAAGEITELTGFDVTDKPWLGLPPTL
jgi:RNA polymerase sigma factor (sigma-70 family)